MKTFGQIIAENRAGFQEKILKTAQTWKGTKYQLGKKGPDKIDCSGFICVVLTEVFEVDGYNSSTMNVAKLRESNLLRTVSMPAVGDLILWAGHGGIVFGDGEFIAANSTKGVEVCSFRKGYWAAYDTANLIFRRPIFIESQSSLRNVPV